MAFHIEFVVSSTNFYNIILILLMTYDHNRNILFFNRYPNKANANDVSIQSIHYTLPEDPGYYHADLLPNSTELSPKTQKPSFYLLDDVPDVSSHIPIVRQPAPFIFSKQTITTPKTPSYHYITKQSKSTSVVSRVPPTTQTSKSKIEKKIIVPTTYAPSINLLKSLFHLKPSVFNQTNCKEENESTNLCGTKNLKKTRNYRPKTNLTNNDYRERRKSELSTTVKPISLPVSEKISTYLGNMYSSDPFTLDIDLTNSSWLLLLERLNYINDNKTFSFTENDTIKSSKSMPSMKVEYESSLEEDNAFTLSPVEIKTKPKLSSTTVRTTPLPTRASRVNPAIKSVIAFGRLQKQYTKCNNNQTLTVNCNKVSQR